MSYKSQWSRVGSRQMGGTIVYYYGCQGCNKVERTESEHPPAGMCRCCTKPSSETTEPEPMDIATEEHPQPGTMGFMQQRLMAAVSGYLPGKKRKMPKPRNRQLGVTGSGPGKTNATESILFEREPLLSDDSGPSPPKNRRTKPPGAGITYFF